MNTFSIRNVVATAVLALTTFTSAAYAQTTTKVKAEVPFMFEYNGHTFASGTYSINMRPDGVVEIGRSRHVQTALAQTQAMDSTATVSSIVFDRAGNKYFLRQIYIAGSSQQVSFAKSRDEKRAREFNVADNGSAPSSVDVAAEASR